MGNTASDTKVNFYNCAGEAMMFKAYNPDDTSFTAVYKAQDSYFQSITVSDRNQASLKCKSDSDYCKIKAGSSDRENWKYGYSQEVKPGTTLYYRGNDRWTETKPMYCGNRRLGESHIEAALEKTEEEDINVGDMLLAEEVAEHEGEGNDLN